MRLELHSQPVEPFLVIRDAMDWEYDNASVDDVGYILCYFDGTTMILDLVGTLVLTYGVSAPFFILFYFYISGFNGFRTQNEEFLSHWNDVMLM